MPAPMITDINTDYRAALNETKQPLPYSIKGVTADEFVANSPKPQSFADFAARGGITNTINEMRNNAIAEQRMKALQIGYEKLLQGGERAAKLVCDSYSQKIQEAGGDPTQYIPPVELFYDKETGYFLPHKYYESVFVGAKKFEEEKLAQNKLAKEEQEKQAKIDSNTAFGQEITANPKMTKQEAVGSALSKGTVTPEMMTAAGAMTDPNKKKDPKQLEFEWAKLRRSQNSDRLREMQILLTQNQKSSESIRKAGEKIADLENEIRKEVQPRKQNLKTLYTKAVRGERVRMDIDGVETAVSVEDLSEMMREVEGLEIDYKATIDELKAMQKTNIVKPARTNIEDAAETITNKYASPETTSPAPMSNTLPVKPTLSITPKPLSGSKPQNDPLGIR